MKMKIYNMYPLGMCLIEWQKKNTQIFIHSILCDFISMGIPQFKNSVIENYLSFKKDCPL